MTAKEMPRRYWRNLPEAKLIAPLAAQAIERSGRMIERPATLPARRIPVAPVPSPLADPDALRALNARLQNCRECPLGELATQAVAGQGPLRPQVMLVGEQPGDQEDLRGQPFVGPAGALLDRALRQLGIARDTVYLTNAVRHFRFELRGRRRIHKTPGQAEVLACRHWLEEEIALVQPATLGALGATAARALLGRPIAVLSARGQWFARNDGLRVLVMLHPSALLRMPPEQLPPAFAQFVRDLAQVWPGERSQSAA
jgi:uracil-DNA glycosylase